MALDFVILDETGTPIKQVCLSAEEHQKLLSDATEASGVEIFKRFKDYYADAEVSVAELDSFLNEAWYLESINQDSSFLHDLKELIEDAQIKQVPVHLIAD